MPAEAVQLPSSLTPVPLTPAGTPAATPPAAIRGYYCSDRPEVAALVQSTGKRILEVGCGAGFMGASLLAHGAQTVVGIELDPAAASGARTRLSAVYGWDLQVRTPLPYPDGYFDYIVFSDVLEHLADPEAVLAHLVRYLAHDGTVITSLPNVRHESVALPLLVDGLWNYTDAGILDRTHLRFFTLPSMVALLAEAGLMLASPPEAVRSDPSPYLERAADFVRSLGGDRARFVDEATVIQYLITARPRLGANRAPRAEDLPDLWAGSQPLRILMAPDFDDPNDLHEPALTAMLRSIGDASDVTIGVALPSNLFGTVPPTLARAAATGTGDLLLFERPTDIAGWQHVLASASAFVVTSDQSDLATMSRGVGLVPTDARSLITG
jgi:SAM-dependent methyltransferase